MLAWPSSNMQQKTNKIKIIKKVDRRYLCSMEHIYNPTPARLILLFIGFSLFGLYLNAILSKNVVSELGFVHVIQYFFGNKHSILLWVWYLTFTILAFRFHSFAYGREGVVCRMGLVFNVSYIFFSWSVIDKINVGSDGEGSSLIFYIRADKRQIDMLSQLRGSYSRIDDNNYRVNVSCDWRPNKQIEKMKKVRWQL